MAEEMLNAPQPGVPPALNYQSLFSQLNRDNKGVYVKGSVVKTPEELQRLLTIPKDAPEATPKYNEVVDLQKQFYNTYQPVIERSFAIRNASDFSSVLRGGLTESQQVAKKQEQRISNIIPTTKTTSVVEEKPLATKVQDIIDNKVSTLEKDFEGVSKDELSKMIYEGQVLGDESSSVVVKNPLVVTKLVYGQPVDETIGIPVDGGYKINYSDYQKYLKERIGLKTGDEQLTPGEQFIFDSKELGAPSQPKNEVEESTSQLKDLYLNTEASKAYETKVSQDPNYSKQLDERSKALLSEDNKKLAEINEKIEDLSNQLFSDEFLVNYGDKETAKKKYQETNNQIKALQFQASRMRKVVGMAPENLFNPLTGKLEGVTETEKQNLDKGIQSVQQKYFSSGESSGVTRPTMINDRNLLWNKIDFIDQQAKDLDAQAKKAGYSLSKVGPIQNAGGLRDRAQVESVIKLNDKFNRLMDERANVYGQLITLNDAIYTNEDIYKRQTDALTRFGESVLEDVYVVRNFSDKNTVRSRIQQVNEMSDYFNKKGVELSPTQIMATEESLKESVAGSIGSTINAGIEIGLASNLIGGVAKLATASKYFDTLKLYATTKGGNVGKFGVTLFEKSLPYLIQGAAYEATNNGFAGGIAETAAEKKFDKFVGQGLEKFSGKYGKLTYVMGRWFAGAVGESLAEVSGNVANIMAENGYDMEATFKEAFPSTDETTKQLAIIGLTSLFMAAPQNLGYLLMTKKKFDEHIAQFGTNEVLDDVYRQIDNAIETMPRVSQGNKIGDQLYKDTQVDPLVFVPASQGPVEERLFVEQRAANNGEEFYLVENDGTVNKDVTYKVDETSGELMVKGFDPLNEGWVKASEPLVNKVTEESTKNGILSADKAKEIASRKLGLEPIVTETGEVLYQASGENISQNNQSRAKNINSTRTMAESKFSEFKKLAKNIMGNLFPDVKAEVSDKQAASYNSYRDKVRGQIKMNAGSFFADGEAVLMESGMNKIPKISDFLAPLLEVFSKTGRVVTVEENGIEQSTRTVDFNRILDHIVSSDFFQERFSDVENAIDYAKTMVTDLLLNDKVTIEKILGNKDATKDFLEFRKELNKYIAKNYTGAITNRPDQLFYRNQMPETLTKSREAEFEMNKEQKATEQAKRNDISKVLGAAGISVNPKNVESVRYKNGDIDARAFLDTLDINTDGMTEEELIATADKEASGVDLKKFAKAVENRTKNERDRKTNERRLKDMLSTTFGMNLLQEFKDKGILGGIPIFGKRKAVAAMMNRVIETAATRAGVTAKEFLDTLIDFKKDSIENFRERYKSDPNVAAYFQRIGEMGAKMQSEIQANYDLANRLESEGKSAESILNGTGWFRGADGNWKYNYVEEKSQIKKDVLTSIASIGQYDSRNYPLSLVYGKSDIYTLYPDLKNVGILFINDSTDKRMQGGYDSMSKDIIINLANVDSLIKLEKVINHEVQHAIQDIEGWQAGTAPEIVERSKFIDVLSYVDEIIDNLKYTGRLPKDIDPKVISDTKSFLTGGSYGLVGIPSEQFEQLSKVIPEVAMGRMSIDDAATSLKNLTTFTEKGLKEFLTQIKSLNSDYDNVLTILDGLTSDSIYLATYGELEASSAEVLNTRSMMTLLDVLLTREEQTNEIADLRKRIQDLQQNRKNSVTNAKKAFDQVDKTGLSLTEIEMIDILLDPDKSNFVNIPIALYGLTNRPLRKELSDIVNAVISIVDYNRNEYTSIVNDANKLINISSALPNDDSLLNGVPAVFKLGNREITSKKKFDSDYNNYIKTKNAVLAGQNIVQQGLQVSPQAGTSALISNKKKEEYVNQLKKRRPDLVKNGKIDFVLNEVEIFGEQNSLNGQGSVKLEKLAMHYILNGNVILPEDGYKVLEANRLAELNKIDPFGYKNPLELINKYQSESKEVRVNPDTVKEFSNKKNIVGGITIYDVDDTKAGQEAVRKIIDTHFGKDANPWCLAARLDGDLERAWGYWNSYSTIPKKIAFKDGKLIAFSASNDGEETWWDKQDNPLSGIPITRIITDFKPRGSIDLSDIKNPIYQQDIIINSEGSIIRLGYITLTDKNRKIIFDGDDGFPLSDVRYKNGKLHGILIQYDSSYKNNIYTISEYKDGLKDGKSIEYHTNGKISEEELYENGILKEVTNYYKSGNIQRKIIQQPNDSGFYIITKITHFYENGNLKEVTGYNNNGDYTERLSYYENGNISMRYSFNENGLIEEIVSYDKDGKIKDTKTFEYDKFNNPLFQDAKGAAVITDTKDIIYALTNPDLSTPLHEIAHIYQKYMTEEEKAAVLEATGEKEWTVNTSEYFARGFEKYLYDGHSPSESLFNLFDKFSTWLKEIYESLAGSDIDVRLNGKMRDLYSVMIGETKPAEFKQEVEGTRPQTFTNELDSFIRDRRAQGMSEDQIYQGLLEAGFKLEDLEDFFSIKTKKTVKSNLEKDSQFQQEASMIADEAAGVYVARTTEELIKEMNSTSLEEQTAIIDFLSETGNLDAAVTKYIREIIEAKAKGEDVTSAFETLVSLGTNVARVLQRFTELKKQSMAIRTESIIKKFEDKSKNKIPEAIKTRLRQISELFDKKKQEYNEAMKLAGQNAFGQSPISGKTNMEYYQDLQKQLESLSETYSALAIPYIEKVSFGKTVRTLIQGNLLTPTSGIINITANVIKSVLNVPINLVSSLLSKAKASIYGTTSSTNRGAGYYGAAWKYGFMEGGRRAWNIIKKGNIPETIQSLEVDNGFNGFKSFGEMVGSLYQLTIGGMSNEEIATKYGYSLNEQGKIPKKEVVNKVLEGLTGWNAEVFFRLLGSADAVFKNMAYYSALHEQAMIEVQNGNLKKEDVDTFIKLNSDYTNETAKNEALRFVYSNDSTLSKYAGFKFKGDDLFSKLMNLTKNGIIPYSKVPSNIIVEYSDIMLPEWGLMRGAFYQYKAAQSKIKAKNSKNPAISSVSESERLDYERRANEVLSRAALGFGLNLFAGTLASMGVLSSGAQDEDKKRKDFMYRFERPYNMNLSLVQRQLNGENDDLWRPDDLTIDYRFLGVFGGILFAAHKSKLTESKEEKKEYANMPLFQKVTEIAPFSKTGETFKYLIDQSFVRGLNQAFAAVDPKQASEGGIERFVTGFMVTLTSAILPNSFSLYDRINRDYVPEFDSPYTGIEKITYDFLNKIKERIPGDFNGLPAKVDGFGRRIPQTPEDRNAFWYNTFDVTKFTRQFRKEEDMSWEMLTYAAVKKGNVLDAMPTSPSPVIRAEFGAPYRMNQQDYEQYAILVGETRRKIVNEFIRNADLTMFLDPTSDLNKKTGKDAVTPFGYELLGTVLKSLYSAADKTLYNTERSIINRERLRMMQERPEEYNKLIEKEKSSIYSDAFTALYDDPSLNQFLPEIKAQEIFFKNPTDYKPSPKEQMKESMDILNMTRPKGQQPVSQKTENDMTYEEYINSLKENKQVPQKTEKDMSYEEYINSLKENK
jgi:antitoxin component YwqK of YwqJK toxin-antitoxin module